MTAEQWIVLCILLGAGGLFVHGRVRVDVVALLVVLALATSGVLSPAEAVAGFGSTVVVLIGSLLVVGEGLARTGVATAVGDAILGLAGGRETWTRTLVVLAAALLGSVMSSTAVVALLLPVTLRIATEREIAPARLLLPLAFGALISGMLTLIGTAPNLVVHAELRKSGLPGLPFFSFTPIGASVLLLALLMFAVAGRWLLPARAQDSGLPTRPKARELWRQFVPERNLLRAIVGAGSPLVRRTPRDSGLGSRFGVRLVAVERGGQLGRRGSLLEPSPDLRLLRGDRVTLVGANDALAAAQEELKLRPDGDPEADGPGPGLGVAVVMIPPDSTLVGRTLAQVGFRSIHHLEVAGIRREGEALADPIRQPLRPADMLLVLGPWSRIRGLSQQTRDFVLLTLPAEFANEPPARSQLPWALGIVIVMVVLSAVGVVPIVVAALAAAVAMAVTGCVAVAEAYRSMSWSSLVLVAGMLPLTTALDRTGLLALATETLGGELAAAGPRTVLAVLFLVTAGLGAFVSNTATAVLMAPVALGLAESMTLRPEAFAMTVAIASSAAFLTPMGSPVVTLVYEPGGYTLRDLLRAGLPLFLGTLAVCVGLVPWVLPF